VVLVELESFLVGLAFGAGLVVVFNRSVERRARSIVAAVKNEKGRAAQIEYSDERQLALAEAVAIYKGEGTNEEKLKAGAALLVKYPRSAAWLLKQARKFQAKGLDGIAE
jgi:hypothetical protein